MKIVLLIGLALIQWSVQGQESKDLESAYKDKSFSQLQKILEDWHQHSSKLVAAPTSKVDKEIYKIFAAFYNPFDFKIYGWTAWGDRRKPFILVQDKIPYKVSGKIKSIPDQIQYVDTLFSFYPELAFKNVKVIHNSKQLNELLKRFVFNSKVWPDNDFDISESFDKSYFLDSAISLSVTPIINSRRFVTQPDIIGIYLNESLDEATIDYVLVSTGMRTKLKKAWGKWVIKESQEMWIAD